MEKFLILFVQQSWKEEDLKLKYTHTLAFCGGFILDSRGEFLSSYFSTVHQPLGEALIRICNLCTLPKIGKPFYFCLFELKRRKTQFPNAKTILTRGSCQLLRHPHWRFFLCRNPTAPSHFGLLPFSSQIGDECHNLKKTSNLALLLYFIYSGELLSAVSMWNWKILERKCLLAPWLEPAIDFWEVFKEFKYLPLLLVSWCFWGTVDRKKLQSFCKHAVTRVFAHLLHQNQKFFHQRRFWTL